MRDPGSGAVIDVHRHHMPSTVVDYLRSRTEPPFLDGEFVRCAAGYGYRLTPEMTDLDANLAEATDAGVTTVVMSTIVGVVDQAPIPDAVALARAVNDEMAALAADRPATLVGMATLPLAAADAAADELDRALGLGLRGALLPVRARGVGLDELGLDPVFALAERRGAPLSLHPTAPAFAEHFGDYALMSTLAFPVDTTATLLRLVLQGLLEERPGLRLVVPHAGSVAPYLMGRIDREAFKYRDRGAAGRLTEAPSVSLRRIYADAISLWPPAIRMLVEVLGADRVMFGSDYPFWGTQENLEAARASSVGERVLAGTAREIFTLEES